MPGEPPWTAQRTADERQFSGLFAFPGLGGPSKNRSSARSSVLALPRSRCGSSPPITCASSSSMEPRPSATLLFAELDGVAQGVLLAAVEGGGAGVEQEPGLVAGP